jgi:hypothetical protein
MHYAIRQESGGQEKDPSFKAARDKHHSLQLVAVFEYKLSFCRCSEVAVVKTVLLLVLAVLLSGCVSEPEVQSAGSTWPTGYEKLITDCPAIDQSVLNRPRAAQIVVSASQDWQQILEAATENTEILLQDGVYQLTQRTIYLQPNITVRGASGNREAVQIVGSGYLSRGQGFMLSGERTTIADLTISNIRDHAVLILPGADEAYLYNLDLSDIGTQHIKASSGGNRNGVVACSSIGYSDQGAVGDYNGAVDLHEAHNWHIARNFIYNIRGDGSGCDVDIQCGRYTSGPAILVWNGSTDVSIYDNTIVDSFRNIALGLGRGHVGGWVADNLILQNNSGDAGIELQTARDVLVERNTVLLGGNYRGAIEYRQSSNILIRQNSVSVRPWDRGNNRSIYLFGNRVVEATSVE